MPSSRSVEPSEYTSDCADGSPPDKTSRAAWATLALICPVVVLWPPSILAMPKSASAGSPLADKRMLAGFTSRWITPASWATINASLILRPTSRTLAGSRGPSSASTSANEPPARYSMMRYGRPSSVTPPSCTTTMFGWLETTPSVWHSRSNRRNEA